MLVTCPKGSKDRARSPRSVDVILRPLAVLAMGLQRKITSMEGHHISPSASCLSTNKRPPPVCTVQSKANTDTCPVRRVVRAERRRAIHAAVLEQNLGAPRVALGKLRHVIHLASHVAGWPESDAFGWRGRRAGRTLPSMARISRPSRACAARSSRERVGRSISGLTATCYRKYVARPKDYDLQSEPAICRLLSV